MSGKAAARVTDLTAHGGTITGPGVPTVLIGGLPAATLGDMHVCPMVTPGTPPIPHVGGPITLGSTGVFIGKKPAARMGDMAVCVGPPSSIVLGCATVLIGEAGSGSQAGPASDAAAAVSAAMTGTKAVAALEAGAPRSALQNHFIDVTVADKKGRPLAGVSYSLKDPRGAELKGATTQHGKIRYEGYAEAGSYQLRLCTLSDAKWSAGKTEIGKSVRLSVRAEGFEEGQELVFHLTGEIDGREKAWFASLPACLSGGKAEVEWMPTREQLETLMAAHVGELTGVTFVAVCQQSATASGKLAIEMDRSYVFRDPKGRPLAGASFDVETRPGKVETLKADAQGRISLGRGCVGRHRAVMKSASDDAAKGSGK